MPRYRKVFEDAHVDPTLLFDAIRTEDPRTLKLLFGEKLGRPLHLLSDAVRGFIWAAPGKQFVVADYSSIEGVLAAWLAGETWKVEAYRALNRGEGHGIYELTAAEIYGVLVELVTKAMRQTGKVAELSCFGHSTLVLTEVGLKRITDVGLQDKLWDGIEWVRHNGLISNGIQKTINLDGVRVTQDHLIRINQTWLVASQLVTNEKILSLALATGSANLPSCVLTSDPLEDSNHSVSGVLAARNTRSAILEISCCDQLDVKSAPRNQCTRVEKNISDMPTLSQTTVTGGDYSDASRPAYNGAETEKTLHGKITAAEAFPFIGETTDESFSSIWSRLKGGICRFLNLIGWKSTEITNREIYGLSRKNRTKEIEEALESCKQRSYLCDQRLTPYENVFDIVNAGPRNRFTIATNRGFLLVHNCQYQGGVGAILRFLRANRVSLAPLFPALWANAEDAARTAAEKRFVERVEKHDPNTQTGRESWIAMELIKVRWRGKHPAITGSWKALEEAAVNATESPGAVTAAVGASFLVKHDFLWMRLPSGRCLAYGKPRMMEVEAPWADPTVEPAQRERKRSLTVRGVDAASDNYSRFPTYGGMYFNALVQGSARDILVHGMQSAEEAGFSVSLHTHDEIGAEIATGSRTARELEEVICRLPAWAEGLPLTAAGFVSKRYKKA